MSARLLHLAVPRKPVVLKDGTEITFETVNFPNSIVTASMIEYSPKSDSFLQILRDLRRWDLIVWERGEAGLSDFILRA